MVEDKNLTEKVRIEKVSKVSSHRSSGFLSNCDNARKVQHLIATAAAAVVNSKERRPFQFHDNDDGDNNNDSAATAALQKSQAVTVIGADQTNNHNSLNANSTIDSRACYKPEKKVIIS